MRALATVGGPTGDEFAAELAASGVPHELIAVQGATRRSIALVDAHLGDTTIVNERGLNPAPAEWDALKEAVRRSLDTAPARSGRPVLVLSGSLPPGPPPTCCRR